MLDREDISTYLVHFIKGDDYEEAFRTLTSIVRGSQLLGGTGFIKGSYRCVCFSEAPIKALGQMLMKPSIHGVKYKPFGIIVEKKWLFEQSGRPVIYETDSEYTNLVEELRWRHVRYEPHLDPPIDFSWEREWRIRVDSLHIDPDVAWLVVPAVGWAYRLSNEYENKQTERARIYAEITDVPEQAWIERFPWRSVVLEEPGQGLPLG
jgi:hypothetical protein